MWRRVLCKWKCKWNENTKSNTVTISLYFKLICNPISKRRETENNKKHTYCRHDRLLSLLALEDKALKREKHNMQTIEHVHSLPAKRVFFKRNMQCHVMSLSVLVVPALEPPAPRCGAAVFCAVFQQSSSSLSSILRKNNRHKIFEQQLDLKCIWPYSAF